MSDTDPQCSAMVWSGERDAAKVVIRDPMVWHRSFADCLYFSEYRPFDDRAAAEIDALIKEVFDGN